jgi:hypothetical protein
MENHMFVAFLMNCLVSYKKRKNNFGAEAPFSVTSSDKRSSCELKTGRAVYMQIEREDGRLQ